jgi:ParB-like chromosome segregation protein Spo0J
MARDGQHASIGVCRLPGWSGWLLVVGGRRLAGASLNGWETIKANVVWADRVDRRRKELSKNLFRCDLDPIDRAAFVAEL